MLKIWIFVTIAVIPLIVSYPSVSEEKAYRLYDGQHDFSISMLKSMEKLNPGQNHIFSPHSTLAVLFQTYLGLKLPNDVLESLKRGMRLDWANSEADVVKAFKSQLLERSTRALGDSIEFESANKLYTSEGFSLKPSALELYANEIEKVDFSDPEARRQEINAWVEKITRNHIKDLIPAGSITHNTALVLANAAFFKGFWVTKFNKDNTRNVTFNGATKANVEMMSVKAKFNYDVLENENAAYLEMPYQTDDNNSMSMFVYLPLENSPTAVDDLLNKISTRTIERALRGAKPQKVDVRFPKINLNSDYKLLKTFKDMGIKGLPFDDVVHKAKIEIDEEGSVAAAATAAVLSRGGSMEDEPVEFHCDHPFVFMINDRVSHEVLFAGVYRPGN